MKSTGLQVPLYNLGKGNMWDVRYKWIVTNKEFIDIINSKEEILQVFDNGQRYVVDSPGRKKISVGNFQNEIDFVLTYEVSKEAVNLTIPSILKCAIEQFYEKEIKRGKEVTEIVLMLKLEMDYINYKKRRVSKDTIFSLRLHDYEFSKYGNIDKFNFAIYPDVKNK